MSEIRIHPKALKAEKLQIISQKSNHIKNE